MFYRKIKVGVLKKGAEFEGVRTSTISGYTDSPVQVKTLDKRLAKASLFGPGYWY